jgi:oxaloacetate decarboxylase alpha subunit/pyruvate carboxylase subunit B
VEKQTNSKAITTRPADLLQPGLECYRQQCADKGLPTDDETVVLFAMFPQQIEALVKGTPAAETKPAPAKPAPPAAPLVPPPSAATHVLSRHQMVLSIDGKRHEVTVEKMAN